MKYPCTYKQRFYPDSIIFEMAKESGRIYSKALELNNKDHKTIKEIQKIMSQMVKSSKYLIQQSAQASYESYITNLKSYFKALKSFQKDPSKFSGEPKPPRKSKFLYKITFKKEGIRRKNNELWLSVRKPYSPIKINWSKDLPLPSWVTITYNKYDGWNINLTIETESKKLNLNRKNFMTIDLGGKRTGATFNSTNHEVKTYNGKTLLSLINLRNKVDARIKSKKTQYKNGSRKHKKLKRAQRKIIRRIKNKENDILHKYSRMVVNDCVENNIGRIIIGNNSSTHTNTNLGKVNNQKITQNLEQKFRKFVTYKFERVSGLVDHKSEAYTSRTCPKCEHINNHSTKGRVFVCDENICGFDYDRDGVGSINIGKKNTRELFDSKVSFDRYWSNVVGGLTPPIGIKYKSNVPRLSLTQKSKIIGLNVSENQLTASGFEEPQVL